MVRKNRRRKTCKHIASLKLRMDIIRNLTLEKFPLVARVHFLETTVLMLADVIERRQKKGVTK